MTGRQTRKETACLRAEREWIVAGAPIDLNPIGSAGAGPWNYSKRNLTSRAHPAKLEFSKTTRSSKPAIHSSGRIERRNLVLLSKDSTGLTHLIGDTRQYGLPKRLIGTSSRIRTTIKFVTRLPGAQYSSSEFLSAACLFFKFLSAETKSPQRRAKASINRRWRKGETIY